jgi:phage-related minor tail protein
MIDPTTGAVQPFASQDLGQVKSTLDTIGVSADKVARSLTSAFANAAVSGKSLDQTLQGIVSTLGKVVVNAGMKPVQQGLSQLISSALSGLGGGGAGGGATAFAEGGIVAQPTFFGSGGGVGLMGERGAEAIIPLSRGPDGRLGLSAGNGSAPTAVHVTISTPDADSFNRSQVQVSSAIARAVARGQRGL